MPRTALRAAPAAVAAAAPLPPDLATLRNAPGRLRAAQGEHQRAATALGEARAARAILFTRLDAARLEVQEADRAFTREQTSERYVERRPTITVVGGGDNPAGIGPISESVRGVEYLQPKTSVALDRLVRAQQVVDALTPRLERYDATTLPTLSSDADRAAEGLVEARRDVDRLEVAIVHHAAPALMAVDGRFAKAAEALEVARLESEVERQRLIASFGYDDRFTASELFHGLPAGIVHLVDPRRAPGGSLADRHALNFAPEA